MGHDLIGRELEATLQCIAVVEEPALHIVLSCRPLTRTREASVERLWGAVARHGMDAGIP